VPDGNRCNEHVKRLGNYKECTYYKIAKKLEDKHWRAEAVAKKKASVRR
jgi:hypothetical protein